MRSFLQVAIQHLCLKAVVGHAYDMACPLLLVPSDGCGDDWDLADTSLVVLLQDLQMYAVGGPAISPIEQGGQTYCLVNQYWYLNTLYLNKAKALVDRGLPR